jgi:serine/threonine protein phosphatase PrpC
VGAALAGLELPERDDDSWRMLAARVAADVVDVWRAAVGADLRASPIDERETAPMAERYGAAALTSLADDPMQAYGTTLLLAVLDRKRCLYAQIGDGDILAVDDRGVVRRPVPADERLIGDRTTSLCTPDAMADFRVCIETSRPALVLLATDGYANSFSTDDEFLLVGSDYLKMIGAEGLDSVAARLEGWLAEASELGSGDDITVGMATSLGHST